MTNGAGTYAHPQTLTVHTLSGVHPILVYNHWPAKAMGINFTMASCSELCESYRKMICLNNPGNVEHAFASAELQAEGSQPCALHGHQRGAKCDPLAGFDTIDLLISGSPCNPFSQQRAKRYVTGDVAEHTYFNVPWLRQVAKGSHVQTSDYCVKYKVKTSS